MARFDVHRVRGTLLLNVQADEVDHLPSRVVVPLLPHAGPLPPLAALTPVFELEGARVTMMTHYLTAVPRRELGRAVANLGAERDAITYALDMLLTGF